MPQSHTAQSILGATPYRNPRHEQEAAALAEHDQANIETDAQEDNVTVTEVKPEHNWEKRYKDLQSYSSKKINGLENEIKDLKQKSVPKLQAPKTQEELEAFKAQNPEMYSVIQSMAQSMFDTKIAEYDSQLAEMRGELNTSAEERAKLKLKEAHPDYQEIIASTQFGDWAAKQSTEVQDWIYNNPSNANLAIQAISLFKYHSGWGKNSDTASAQPEHGGDLSITSRAAVDPGVTDRKHPAYIWKESEIGKMRPEEFDKWQDDITLAQSEGRILLGQ